MPNPQLRPPLLLAAHLSTRKASPEVLHPTPPHKRRARLFFFTSVASRGRRTSGCLLRLRGACTFLRRTALVLLVSSSLLATVPPGKSWRRCARAMSWMRCSWATAKVRSSRLPSQVPTSLLSLLGTPFSRPYNDVKAHHLRLQDRDVWTGCTRVSCLWLARRWASGGGSL